MSETAEKKEKKTVSASVRKVKTKPYLLQSEDVVVYVGPDIPGVVKRYKVFNNGIPEKLSKKLEENPVFQSMVVPVEKLAQVNAELAKEGSALHVLYQKAVKSKGEMKNGI